MVSGSPRLFERDRSWLQRQPGMTPWRRGCALLREQLDTWLAEYSERVCDQPLTNRHAAYPVYLDRLWACWGYHWHQAADRAQAKRIDGREVARRIRSGRGLLRGGQLGGDPLRDMVLAAAMPRRDERALQCFQLEYFDFLRRMAGRRGRCFYRDPDSWWNDFLDHLAGYTRPTAKLDRFDGRCALRNWLGTVLWNFLRRWNDAPTDGPSLPDEGIADGRIQGPLDQIERRLPFFACLVRQALDKLPRQDRLVLYLLYVDCLNLNQAGAILGRHPANVGRRRDKARLRLRETLLDLAVREKQVQPYLECLDSLQTSPTDFANALYQALTDAHQSGRRRRSGPRSRARPRRPAAGRSGKA
jgi:DNA-directed RNA polymerase specialized sigma24 family protein